MKENLKEHPVFNNPVLKNYECDGQLVFTEENKNLKIVEEHRNKDKNPCKFI